MPSRGRWCTPRRRRSSVSPRVAAITSSRSGSTYRVCKPRSQRLTRSFVRSLQDRQVATRAREHARLAQGMGARCSMGLEHWSAILHARELRPRGRGHHLVAGAARRRVAEEVAAEQRRCCVARQLVDHGQRARRHERRQPSVTLEASARSRSRVEASVADGRRGSAGVRSLVSSSPSCTLASTALVRLRHPSISVHPSIYPSANQPLANMSLFAPVCHIDRARSLSPSLCCPSLYIACWRQGQAIRIE